MVIKLPLTEILDAATYLRTLLGSAMSVAKPSDPNKNSTAMELRKTNGVLLHRLKILMNPFDGRQ